ncbi:MAG TPA: OsmC family protein [Bacillota bacterium]|nr:OsmC family protein [Bacillota bacterium]
MKFSVEDEKLVGKLGYGDLPLSANDDEGYRPFQLLVSSIVGCSTIVYERILKKQKIDYEIVDIEAEVERNEKEANRIEYLKITFKLKGDSLNLEKLEKNMEVASENCPMVRSVDKNIRIEKVIEIVE